MPWSYSAITTFEKCPKQYYHTRVLREYPFQETPALRYGKEGHKAAEDFISGAVPLPGKFKFMQPVLDAVNKLPGNKHVELEMGVFRDGDVFIAGKFDDSAVWYRGIADLVVVDDERERGFLIDYKTGKNARYADTRQLDLLAGAVFLHFPRLKTIQSGLAYVVSNEMVPKQHVVEKRDEYLRSFDWLLERRDAAEKSGVWNAISSPLCRFCPVSACAHWQG